MEVRFGNRKRIRFSDKKHPKHGIISVVLGVLSIIILLTLCIVSGHAKGRAGMEIGALGLATMVLSIIGFVLAVRCNKEEDIYHVTPAVGSVLNGIWCCLLKERFKNFDFVGNIHYLIAGAVFRIGKFFNIINRIIFQISFS